MSVLIKGMEPSNRCLGCKFELYGQYCFLLGSYTNDTRAIGRLDNCPVVGLPEKHGRLVDADELKTAFPTCDNSKPVLVSCVRQTINHMPTVIEAEGDE